MESKNVNTTTSVYVNSVPLIDDTDFKTIENSITYDATGMWLVWNFTTTGSEIVQTQVTPTTGGDYDWEHVGSGIYKIEIPASGGASINNDTVGYGFFSGSCSGVLPWVGPKIAFRPEGLNDVMMDYVEGSFDLRDILRVMFSVLAGESSGGGTSTIVFDDITGSGSRITATVDSSGNRTSIEFYTE